VPRTDNSYKLGIANVGGREVVVVAVDDGPTLALDQPGPQGQPPPEDLLSLLSDRPTWASHLEDVVARRWPTSVIDGDVDWRLPRLGDKLICIGANYTDHISEMDVPPPPWPYSFVVPPSSTLVLTGTPVEIPRGVQAWDWEAEVAVVLDRTLRYATVEEAAEAVALYVPLNDLSARDAGTVKIAFGIDMTMIKAHDNSKVVGALFTPAHFVDDPAALKLTCTVNGAVMQDFSTATMIFSIAECVAHLSTIMTLEPGDVISTGTGGGVGALQKPPVFLADGDLVDVEVSGLGRATTPIVGASA